MRMPVVRTYTRSAIPQNGVEAFTGTATGGGGGKGFPGSQFHPHRAYFQRNVAFLFSHTVHINQESQSWSLAHKSSNAEDTYAQDGRATTGMGRSDSLEPITHCFL